MRDGLDLDAIEAQHRVDSYCEDRGDQDDHWWCVKDREQWPCDAARLVAEVRSLRVALVEAERERDEWRKAAEDPWLAGLVENLREAERQRDAAYKAVGSLIAGEGELLHRALDTVAAIAALREKAFPIQRVDNEWIDVVKWDRIAEILAGAGPVPEPRPEMPTP